ncbi:hypothetical protein SAMN02745121_06254 [Nannocystis exedens]|uniref:Uncharacterized protein n=1 Tax=Nannocystis exedens TaxID=54 RepID=A0A1I2ESB1_9BACT|nr:hypothetical protein NAEX_06915 [Nannocystis exedens]SFE95715.1 hypothetical protein SAMN02745121_06254 [Nannocystis exedens]
MRIRHDELDRALMFVLRGVVGQALEMCFSVREPWQQPRCRRRIEGVVGRRW